MPTDHRAALRHIRTFPALVRYLRDEMDWPIDSDDFEDLTFDETPEDLGIDPRNAAKIEEIKRLRPFTNDQPWGIFFVNFEPRRLPVVALRRILSGVAMKKRASANSVERPAWQMDDLLFISNYGEGDQRQISFAHFAQAPGKTDLPTLKVLGWDDRDTALHLDAVAETLTQKLAWPRQVGNLEAWRTQWRLAFTLGHREVITTSQALSVRLAALARAMRTQIKENLAIETERGPYQRLLKAFQQALIHDLDADGFADMYAQTIAYGLLAARVENPKAQTADALPAQMPVTNSFLKELMETFLQVGGRQGQAGGPGLDFDELGISEVVELLDAANMEAVIKDFGDKNREEDPVIHFYEVFLKEYDAQRRMQRGVFYTPHPVVSYIVRSVHELLKTEFGLEDGLASIATWKDMQAKHPDLRLPESVKPEMPFVQILDPATGTATFLVEVIEVIYRTLIEKWEQQGMSEKRRRQAWNDYVPQHLLPRLYGYELMMAPYAIAHMKIGLKLHETGYEFRGADQRVRVYLTNALEPASDVQGGLEGISPALAHEAKAVNRVKYNERFTVVIGNPPYSNFGKLNKTLWILSLISDYKSGLNERKINIDDDYIKFIRFTQYIICRTGLGIVSMITNNSYLDGVTHRKMRQDLIKSFSRYFILNLHGNSIKKEGDDNVFDIRIGVAIGTFIKSISSRSTPYINYLSTFDQEFNKRESKYKFLINSTITHLQWSTLLPREPWFWFFPKFSDTNSDQNGINLYEKFWSITEIFSTYSVGIKTKIDSVAIDFDENTLRKRVSDILNNQYSTKQLAIIYGINQNTTWEYERARKAQYNDNKIIDYDYRPLDVRKVYYDNNFLSRSRSEVMDNFVGKQNIGLEVGRLEFIAFISRRVSDEHFCGGCSYKFPLWVYQKNKDIFRNRNSNINVNFSDKFRSFIEKTMDRPEPETVLSYIYAILHSKTYREKYAEQLNIGFPRIPFIANLNLFRILSNIGKELIILHLMESEKINQHLTVFQGSTNLIIEKISWAKNTAWIDKKQTRGFQGVPEDVWNFHIGGYQVCEKWLKDRKGRTLTADDINHYHSIVVALSETIRLMTEIDEVIDEHGGWPEAFVDGSR